MTRRPLKTLRPAVATRLQSLSGAPGRPLVKRMTGRPLQRARAELFKRQPLCVLCLAAGKVEPATERDHVQPLALGGSDTDPANTRALRTACNRAERDRVFGALR